MATVSFDERGLLIDGRRRWLVGGTIDPARIPAEDWGSRLDAAAASGLTAVTVPIAWSEHEPLQGQFRFEGQHDVARFVRLAGERKLLVVLRPGPFLGAGWDRGAIPAWVDPGIDEGSGRPLALRSSAPEFLAACGAWIAAVAERLTGLQASSGGPIVLVQNEHRWFCGDADEAQAYLGELARRLRETGFNVPLVNTNNLFAGSEGEIEAWNGYHDGLATFRQLRAVRPNQPALAWDFELGRPPVWGKEAEAPPAPSEALHAIAQAMAAGAQVNLGPFAGGSRFGFSAGRLPFSRDGFVAQSADDGAPLDESGRPTETLGAIRPLLMFASSFERLFAMADWSSPSACLTPGERGVPVVQASGDAGSVVFVFRSPGASTARKDLRRDILLPDGRSLEVDLKDRPVVWCLLDAPLDRSHRLDYANASVIWNEGRALAVSAPAGSDVALSINGSALHATAPRGKKPEIIEHEDVTVAVLSTDQASVAIRTPEGLLIGAESESRPAEGCKSWTRIGRDGATQSGNWNSGASPGARITLTGWSCAAADEFVDGESERFAVIDRPESLEKLGVNYGYGWLRATFRTTSARRPKVSIPQSNDRVHVYASGEFTGVAGLGPGASEAPFPLPLARGENAIVLLIDNLGRPAGGWSDLQRKGVWGPIWETKPLRVGKPKLERGDLLSPLSFRTPLTRLHEDDRTHPQRVTWSFTHRRKSPIALRLGPLPEGFQALLVVNGEVVEAIDEGARGVFVLADELRQGKNAVQLATLSDPQAALDLLGKQAVFEELASDVTEKAEWSFARWEPPADRLFEPCPKNHNGEGRPIWRRATFRASPDGEPLALDPRGLTKGQAFLNGRNLGRYFEAGPDGEAIPGQRGIYLPAAWLLEGENTLTLFDEHGASAERCRVTELRKLRG